ncbi:MAG: hypothetical protein J5J06_13710 [Phycisphaerae bacterium]|nr:hypothetical protein [Phycisphaerae bacterium]
MMKCIMLLAAMMVVTAVAPARADVIYGGTCFPDVSHTNGQPGMTATHEFELWDLVGTRISLHQDMMITGFNAVAITDVPFESVVPRINIYAASGGTSREQMFANSPLVGNVFSGTMSMGTPVPFGQSMEGFQSYYINFSFTPFTLPAGDYILSSYVDLVGGSWAWVQTDQNLGSAIEVWSGEPGNYYDYSSFGPPYTTGSAGVDLIGTPIPEPASICLLSAGSLLATKRLRREVTTAKRCTVR